MFLSSLTAGCYSASGLVAKPVQKVSDQNRLTDTADMTPCVVRFRLRFKLNLAALSVVKLQITKLEAAWRDEKQCVYLCVQWTVRMRSRSNSGVRLDGYARLVQETILCHQVSSDTHCRMQQRNQCCEVNRHVYTMVEDALSSPTVLRRLCCHFTAVMGCYWLDLQGRRVIALFR